MIFYCVYAEEQQYHILPTDRLMQFTGVNNQTYPLGLKFITTVLGLDQPAPTSAAINITPQSTTEKEAAKTRAMEKAKKTFIDEIRECAEMLQKGLSESLISQNTNNTTAQFSASRVQLQQPLPLAPKEAALNKMETLYAKFMQLRQREAWQKWCATDVS